MVHRSLLLLLPIQEPLCVTSACGCSSTSPVSLVRVVELPTFPHSLYPLNKAQPQELADLSLAGRGIESIARNRQYRQTCLPSRSLRHAESDVPTLSKSCWYVCVRYSSPNLPQGCCWHLCLSM
uniref:Secreted protein n=1 Tax=Leishmania guyanensis TaxID=5670 RepID=A0A1E1J321_LEIGU|nr:Hypothetical protein BN36_3154160 [Leishmania guyanensis]CCM17928.1 Hypothetical protein BN36_3154200 [Leishmania guyanensis]